MSTLQMQLAVLLMNIQTSLRRQTDPLEIIRAAREELERIEARAKQSKEFSSPAAAEGMALDCAGK